MGAHRPMTVPEKYYTFLDRRWPVNAVISADLARRFAPDDVARAWQELRTRRVVARAVATEELTIADPGPDPEGAVFGTREADPADWPAIIEELSDAHYDLGTPVQCWYVTSPTTDESRVILVGHHAIIDGRIGVTELQWLVRLLDGQDVPEQQQLAAEPEPAAAHAWQRDRAAMIDLLRQLKTRNTAYGEPGPATWADPSVERRSWMRHDALGPEEVAPLVATGRAHGANLFSTVAAALLTSTARVLGGADESSPEVTLQFAAPADIAAPSTDPDRAQAMAIAVLAQPYRVDVTDLWRLSGDIRATVHEARARGEGELFFHLSRLGNVVDLDAGRDLVSGALVSGHPCVVVSNLGVTDPGSDPEWLTTIMGQLAAAPNQMVFLAINSYRGRLLHTFSTDDNRISPEQRDALVTGYRTILRELADEGVSS